MDATKINPTNPWMPWLIIIIVVAVIAAIIYLYKTKKGTKMRKTVVLAGLMLLVGFVLLWFAVYYQQRLVKNNDLLSEMEGKPALGYRYIVSFNRWMRINIPLLATIGIMLCIVGVFLLCLPKLSLKT